MVRVNGVKISGAGTADITPAVPFRCPHEDAEGVPGWPRGRAANQPGSTRTLSPSAHVGRRWVRRHRHMGQTVKLRGNPEGQR